MFLLLAAGCTKKIMVIVSPEVDGEMWVHNDSTNGFPVVINSQNVYVNISGFNRSVNNQNLFNVGYDSGKDRLVCLHNGTYEMTYDISTGNAGNNQEYQFLIGINGEEQENTDSHRKIGAAGDVGDASDVGYIKCVEGDHVTLMSRNNDGNANLNVHSASINIRRMRD